MSDYRYDRKIKYIDYKVNGERQCSAGFIKLERRGGSCHFLMRIGGVHLGGSLRCPVYLCATGKEEMAGEVMLRNGQGDMEQRYMEEGHLFQTNISYEEVLAVRIPIAVGRELYCRVSEKQMGWDVLPAISAAQIPKIEAEEVAPVENQASAWTEQVAGKQIEEPARVWTKEPERVQAEKTIGMHMAEEPERVQAEKTIGMHMAEEPERVQAEKTIGMYMAEEPERMQAEKTTGMHMAEEPARAWTEEAAGTQMEESVRIQDNEESSESEARSASRDTPEVAKEKIQGKAGTEDNRGVRDRKEEGEELPEHILEDKWKQLCAIYPHSFPFDDDREYLKLGPSDFVILTEASYRLVNNSFLLHGYYNYRHLILTRLLKRGEYRYYIGVPGNYYEREKQVAVMFGFEIFECRKEPAQEGDFGYYLIPVSL